MAAVAMTPVALKSPTTPERPSPARRKVEPGGCPVLVRKPLKGIPIDITVPTYPPRPFGLGGLLWLVFDVPNPMRVGGPESRSPGEPTVRPNPLRGGRDAKVGIWEV